MAARSAPQKSNQHTGWIIFTALLLAIAGGFNIFYGLAALLNDEVLRVGGPGVLILNLSVWGWFHLVTGVLMFAASFGLISEAGWARWTAIALVFVNALIQFVSITSFPIAAALMILLDIVIVYQLTVHWNKT